MNLDGLAGWGRGYTKPAARKKHTDARPPNVDNSRPKTPLQAASKRHRSPSRQPATRDIAAVKLPKLGSTARRDDMDTDTSPGSSPVKIRQAMTPASIRAKTVIIPRASAKWRKRVMSEGAPGWHRAARRLVKDWKTKVRNAMAQDRLITDDELAGLDRVTAAADIAPFLPPEAIEKALAIPPDSARHEDAKETMFGCMVSVLSNWSVSSIRNAASVWVRTHIFWHVTDTPHHKRYRGDTIDNLLKSVRASAERRAKALHRKRRRSKKSTSGRVMTGGTAVAAFRRGLAFLNKHFGLPFPVQSAILTRTRRRSGHRTRHGESLSLKMVTAIERAAISHPLPTVRAACTAFSTMI